MFELLWLLLPVAAASGWWAAQRDAARRSPGYDRRAEYFRGLNYLLDEKPDRAIEVFGRIVASEPDTVEAQLTLGNLFRRRGEVDRAIQLHGELLARNDLTPTLHARAQFELAEDYLRAGLFDRAEELFLDVVAQPEYRAHALARLLSIYEQEKDWRKAIDHCRLVEQATGLSKRTAAAHYCCELAEETIAAGDTELANRWLEQALALDSHGARAPMRQARLASAQGDYAAAAEHYRRAVRQAPAYLPEVLEPLKACYLALGREVDWLAWLREIAAGDHSGAVSAALAEALRRLEGPAAALAFLEAEIRVHPSMDGLRYLIDLKLGAAEPVRIGDLELLYRIGRDLLERGPRYRCDNCGFVGKALHWQCPGCKAWSTVKPVPDRLRRA